MYGSDSWKIEGEPIYWFFAITVLAAAVYLGFRTWMRMKKNRKIALLEIFRILIIVILLLRFLTRNGLKELKLIKSRKSSVYEMSPKACKRMIF